jgi:uncharacterized membrane protein YidH (DUF202 family)
MNQQLLAFGVFLLVVGVVSIASSSIGINCYNNCKDQKEANKNNFNFLVLNLVLAILLTLGAVGFLYLVSVQPGRLSSLGLGL